MNPGFQNEFLVYLGMMIVLWFIMFVVLGRLLFFDSWGKFGRSLFYALLVPWGLAALMGDLAEDIDSGMSVAMLFVLSLAFIFSLHAGMGDTLQALVGVEVEEETAMSLIKNLIVG